MDDWAEIEIRSLRQLFEDSPRFRMIAEVARRCHLPYDVVRDEWTDEAIHADEALARIHAAENADRCGHCGVHPDDMLDERGRLRKEDSTWKVARVDCQYCKIELMAQDQLTDEDRKTGAYLTRKPRGEGEPMVDMGMD